MPCFLHKQPGLAGAILFLFPIFTSPLALFSNSGLEGPPPSSLHPASWPGPEPLQKASVCVCVTQGRGTHSLACIHLVTGSSLPAWGVVWGGPSSSPELSPGEPVVAVGVPRYMTQFSHTLPLVLGWRLRFGVVMTGARVTSVGGCTGWAGQAAGGRAWAPPCSYCGVSETHPRSESLGRIWPAGVSPCGGCGEPRLEGCLPGGSRSCAGEDAFISWREHPWASCQALVGGGPELGGQARGNARPTMASRLDQVGLGAQAEDWRAVGHPRA